jgi:hypothetical protein
MIDSDDALWPLKGVDPTQSQWAELSGLFERKGHALSLVETILHIFSQVIVKESYSKSRWYQGMIESP